MSDRTRITCLCARSYVQVLMHSCVESRPHFQLLCLQVRSAAASSYVPQIQISFARGLLMASTCVSHYGKLQILPSKRWMFHSHFVISSTRKKLLPICDARQKPLQPSQQFFETTGDASLAVQRHGFFLFCLEWISIRPVVLCFGCELETNE